MRLQDVAVLITGGSGLGAPPRAPWRQGRKIGVLDQSKNAEKVAPK
jgi:hypothetical protein